MAEYQGISAEDKESAINKFAPSVRRMLKALNCREASPHCDIAPNLLSRASWGPVDILVAATVLAAYSVFRVSV